MIINGETLGDEDKLAIYDFSFKSKKDLSQFQTLTKEFIESRVAQSDLTTSDAANLQSYLNTKYKKAEVEHIDTEYGLVWKVSFEKYAKREEYVLALKPVSSEVKTFLNNWKPLTLKVHSKLYEASNALDLINAIEKIQSELFEISRFKGLGEMNPKELRDTGMVPDKRIIEQVSIADLEQTDYITKLLMGEDVPLRRKFIEDNALNANVDL